MEFFISRRELSFLFYVQSYIICCMNNNSKNDNSLLLKRNSINPILVFIAKYQFISFHVFPLDTLYRTHDKEALSFTCIRSHK